MTPLYDPHGRIIPPATPQAAGGNRLSGSTSPYLLQHANNPVDWYPWGPEALEKARSEDRPIFLSIGYAACHWCHVMERESFEDDGIARLMNENFVCIKVDREERPDLDDIYMSAVHLLTGSGGWPLTVFLTPDLKPFYGGTYFPPDDRFGRPGMRQLLRDVAIIYRERRTDVDQQAAELTRAVQAVTSGPAEVRAAARAPGDAGTASAEAPQAPAGSAPAGTHVGRGPLPGSDVIDRAARQLIQTHDPEWGGFGRAPKFPPAQALSLLLRYYRRTGDEEAKWAVCTTLDHMAMGGLHDHLGGGFARYSTDEQWLVPHFEKMLYDNALLVSIYSETIRALGDGEAGLYRRAILDTLSFVERELSDPAGGFYSSLDADSEGVEGKYYVWTAAEIQDALGAEDAAFFSHFYGVREEGNWDQTNILWLPRPPGQLAREAGIPGGDDDEMARLAETRLAPLREKLLAVRSRRVRPGLDDKVLTAWNGLMISAYARAAQALDDTELARPAERAADFLLGNMFRHGRLLRTWRRGHADIDAYLEDYAFLAVGLIDLYETTFDLKWLRTADDLVKTAILHFRAPNGGFFFTADDHEELPARPRSIYDSSIPSGNSMMAMALLRLSLLLDRPEWRQIAENTVAAVAGSLAESAGGHHTMLGALDWICCDRPVEVAIVGPKGSPHALGLLSAVRRAYFPNRVLAWLDPASDDAADTERFVALVRGKAMVRGTSTAYVCRNYACREPVTDSDDLERQLEE